MHLEFRFERGGTLRAKLAAEAKRTIECISNALPMGAKVFQARWSGREIFVPVNLAEKPPREHQSIRVSLGDVIYFCEWAEAYEHTGFEAIGMFYGPEIVREWRGDAPVNVFAQIDPSQWDLLKEIGERVWRQGGENIDIHLIADGGL
ncbi:MAG: DUF3830 family protein [Pseudomonadota bacterium]